MTRFDGAPMRPILTAALLLLAWAAPAAAALNEVKISQIYGGGGNAGATYKYDFIELKNRGTTPVSLAGVTVQYASSTGGSWAVTTLTGTIPAGGYYLIQESIGAGGTQDLPAPDAIGTIQMGGTAGKVALVGSTTALTGVCPIDVAPGAAIDFVGYGTGTNCYEGVGPTGATSNTTAALRQGGGDTDTNSNAADFIVAAPTPRNTGSAGGGGGTTPQDVAIYTIQGSGNTSPLVGVLVRTPGVVTRVNNNGFFMQDLTGDGNPATSDGIFVFTGSTAYPAVAVGNLVAATGTVVEFNTGAAGNADTAAHTVTELTDVTAVALTGTGYVIAPTPVTLPEAINDDLERYEGMLVRIDGPFTIQQNFFQGRYGQLTLAVGGRLETPTNRYRPGSAQAQAATDENARRRIILDDGSSLQNPNPTPYLGAGALPRAGDVLVGSLTGVIDYGLATSSSTDFGDYKIHPTVMPSFAIANPRTIAPAPAGGNVKVASFNVLNYFTTFTDATTAGGQAGQGCSLGGSVSASNCRGADNLTEFMRQRAKIVEAMAAIDADVLGLMEIQNNGSVAAQNLVDALNARIGAAAYAVLPLPAQGTGTDAIRVAMIYKPARLGLAGAPTSDPAAINNRPPLAQTFVLANGERFSLIVNHLKSKSSCPSIGDADYAGNFDSGDGQGCWNLQRLQQARQLRTFVAQVQNASGSNDVLLIGDFNAYAQEDPIFDLVSSGYVDQAGRFAAGAYSYVFNGAAGRIDHAISTATLSSRVVSAAHWHINADETTLADYNTEFKAPALCNPSLLCPADPYTVSPYRSSDHDPVVVGLALFKACDVNGDGRVDATDLALIRARNGQAANGPNDPFDANHDGVIGVSDVRYCQGKMTAGAAP